MRAPTTAIEGRSGPSPPERLGPEAGIGLVEVLTAALMVVILAVGILGAVQSLTRAGAQERTRVTAHALAQTDQSRMRNFDLAELSNYSETRAVEDGGTTFDVSSQASFISDATGTASCGEEEASADYIQVTSTITWPTLGSRPPVVLQSTIAPPNGSISPDAGALAVRVEDGAGDPLGGVGISGTGGTGFSGQTNENGCVIFGNLPSGNYELLAGLSGVVDRDGNPPSAQTTSVIPFATNVVVLQYDEPGSIDVDFTTNLTGTLQPSTADSVIVFNSGMSAPQAYGEIGTPVANMTISPLFPFSSPNAVYAGACTRNNPNPNGNEPPPASQASVLVVPGGTVAATIQLPALDLQVWSGTDAGSPGAPVAGAEIRLIDRRCRDEFGVRIRRYFTANSQGELPDPGVPRSRYNVCVSDGSARIRTNNHNVLQLNVPYVLDLYLGSATESGSC